MNISQLEKRRLALASERAVWEKLWREAAKYHLPHRLPDVKGRTGLDEIWDATPLRCADRFASYLHSYLTSSVNRWFQLKARSPKVDRMTKRWLQQAEDQLYLIFNASNWAPQMHQLYLDLGVLGTGILYIESDPEYVVRFMTCSIFDVLPVMDVKDRLLMLFRTPKFTNEMVANSFPNLPSDLKEAAISRPDDTADVVHVVMPADTDELRITTKGKPVASIYYHAKSRQVLSIGGYDSMPFVVARWSVSSGEVYGRGPALNSLPDAKTLQKISKTVLRASEKAVDPPLLVPDEGVVGSVRLAPAGLTYLRPDVFRNKAIPTPLITGARLEVGAEQIKQKQEAIADAFYLDLFIAMQDTTVMTAREVSERSEEKLGLLAPILSRIMSEMLSPMISRVFKMGIEQKAIPPPPTGEPIDVEYISPLAIAQKLSRIRSIQQVLSGVSLLAQLDPTIIERVDVHKTLDVLSEVYSFPQEALRSVDEAMQRVMEKQQSMAEANVASLATQTMAEIAKKGAINAPSSPLQASVPTE